MKKHTQPKEPKRTLGQKIKRFFKKFKEWDKPKGE